HEPRLVGISATVLSSLHAVAELIEDARTEFGSDIRIVVGGSAFGANPDSWSLVGADGYGRDLRDAVRAADELVPRGS
ncbi:MAG TPA: cobalamin-binding protein, partial [Gemmatimonadota bacterium]|nr:cobalamin-binding protein [Gemmatimonadota bacterium]